MLAACSPDEASASIAIASKFSAHTPRMKTRLKWSCNFLCCRSWYAARSRSNTICSKSFVFTASATARSCLMIAVFDARCACRRHEPNMRPMRCMRPTFAARCSCSRASDSHSCENESVCNSLQASCARRRQAASASPTRRLHWSADKRCSCVRKRRPTPAVPFHACTTASKERLSARPLRMRSSTPIEAWNCCCLSCASDRSSDSMATRRWRNAASAACHRASTCFLCLAIKDFVARPKSRFMLLASSQEIRSNWTDKSAKAQGSSCPSQASMPSKLKSRSGWQRSSRASQPLPPLKLKPRAAWERPPDPLPTELNPRDL
mmetsp:Transcript_64458/g.179303  ORF Transcript_64458/g.179303 Transcript_64458/m.179303 type:complete len:321 (+) Transcript_64458:434-1396(+)